MTTSSSTQNAQVYASNAVPGMVDPPAHPVFSSSSILEFARLQTGLIDDYMNGQMATMQNARAEVDALNAVNDMLAQYADRDAISGGDYDKVKNGLLNAASGLPDGSPAKEKLLELANDNNSVVNTDGAGGTDGQMGKDDISSLSHTLSSMEKDAEQRGQDASLVIQQKMGDRGNIISQATELLRDLNDTTKNIISKWGT